MLDAIFGAERPQHIPEKFQTYEAIAGIEFIHCPKEPIDFKSFAYRKTDAGAQTRTRIGEESELVDADLTVEEAHAFIEKLCATDLFTWQQVYKPSQGSFVLVTTNWRIKVEFLPMEGESHKPFESEGEEMTPDSYENVVAALFGL